MEARAHSTSVAFRNILPFRIRVLFFFPRFRYTEKPNQPRTQKHLKACTKSGADTSETWSRSRVPCDRAGCGSSTARSYMTDTSLEIHWGLSCLYSTRAVKKCNTFPARFKERTLTVNTDRPEGRRYGAGAVPAALRPSAIFVNLYKSAKPKSVKFPIVPRLANPSSFFPAPVV